MLKSVLASVLMFSSQAFAQVAGAPAAAAPAQNPLMQFLPLVVVFVIFYFLMIRPQKKKYDQEQALLKELAKGDEIYTKSGLIGTIYGMTDTVVTLEVSEGVRFKVLKSQIAGLYKSLTETAKK
jgi:preprotein translocase subunit YajC